MIEKAIRDHLVTDISVTSGLAVYDFGSGTAPAVFTMQDPPDDSPRPCALIGQVSASDFGTRDKRGSEIFADVVVWGDREMSLEPLRDVSVAVWESLNRAHICPGYGYSQILCMADAPLRITDPEGFPGYNIRVRVVVYED